MQLRRLSRIDNTKRTFRAELGRAISTGANEAALVTFAVLVGVRVFDSSPITKALIFSSAALGMIVSLFTLPIVARLGWRLTWTSAGLGCLGGLGLLASAIFWRNEVGFMGGVYISAFMWPVLLPLQAQWLRQHYPNGRRGRLFATANVVKALVTMIAGGAGGWWLSQDIENYRALFFIFGGLGIGGSLCTLAIPEPTLAMPSGKPAERPRIFNALHWLKDDRVFARVIWSAMAMGLGVLMVNALRVDYLANPEFGLNYDEATVGLLTASLPAGIRLLSTMAWGTVFDRIDFIWMRTIINVLFAAAILMYFLGDGLWMIAAGAALFGLARGGGEILWNLWVTKLARAEDAGEYMSVHTCFTGLRALVAPLVGFVLAATLAIGAVVSLSMVFVTISIALLIPLLRSSEVEGRR